MQKKVAPKLNSQQQKGLEGKNVSDQIRFLNKEGFARADIARILQKRYQHIRNVLEQDKISKSS